MDIYRNSYGAIVNRTVASFKESNLKDWTLIESTSFCIPATEIHTQVCADNRPILPTSWHNNGPLREMTRCILFVSQVTVAGDSIRPSSCKIRVLWYIWRSRQCQVYIRIDLRFRVLYLLCRRSSADTCMWNGVCLSRNMFPHPSLSLKSPNP